VSCSRIDKIRKSELLDSPQALERARLHNTPQHQFQVILIDIEFDEIMKWVTDTLLPEHEMRAPLAVGTHKHKRRRL